MNRIEVKNNNKYRKSMLHRNLSEETKNLTFSSLVIMSRLGRGSTCHVFKTQSIRTKKHYAMKVIDKSKSDYDEVNLSKQIQIHQRLRHHHIVQFVQHFEDEANHYILTEYCNNGEISKFLMQPPTYSKLLKILYQIGQALHYMHHEAQVAHGDVKLSNILISGTDFKLCDFGFSHMLARDQKGHATPQRNQIFGTLLYMSPEILINHCHKYYQESDVWALGICILTLMLQGNPYQAQNPSILRKRIINGQMVKATTKNFPTYPQQFVQLISRMLEQDHRKRIKLQQMLKHPLFAKFTAQKQKCNKEEEITTEKQDNQVQRSNQDDCERVSVKTESQKEDINRSVFNSTIDTLVDAEDTPENIRIWSYSLRPQKHQTQNNGFIQILPDHNIKVKVDKIEFQISSDGSTLEITKGSKNLKKYSIAQINQNNKIKCLYEYGVELVQILKKKQCFKEKMIGGKYFWKTKNSVCCLIDEKSIIEQVEGSKQTFYRKIGQRQLKLCSEEDSMAQNMPFFQKGVSLLLQDTN